MITIIALLVAENRDFFKSFQEKWLAAIGFIHRLRFELIIQSKMAKSSSTAWVVFPPITFKLPLSRLLNLNYCKGKQMSDCWARNSSDTKWKINATFNKCIIGKCNRISTRRRVEKFVVLLTHHWFTSRLSNKFCPKPTSQSIKAQRRCHYYV